ncbi:MAG: pyridoxamine 5'-phosphate oxidase family protein [Rhizobacter sp.]|nr:pyridoxamine 5'-phosphate oxidase family protein [Rhizobacter sp.]
MSALSFLFGAHAAHTNPLFERGKRCVLTTLSASGHLHTRKVKVGTCSEDGKRLWFVLAAGDGIELEIAHNPSVTVSVIDDDTNSLVHVSGQATPLGERSSPLYLQPDFRQARSLNVVPAEIDFTLLRVDLDLGLDIDLGNVRDMPARHSSQ